MYPYPYVRAMSTQQHHCLVYSVGIAPLYLSNIAAKGTAHWLA